MPAVLLGALCAVTLTLFAGAFLLPLAHRWVWLWTWLYTLSVPAGTRERRRQEMASHLHEEIHVDRQEGYRPAEIGLCILARWALGAPADVCWAIGQVRPQWAVLRALVDFGGRPRRDPFFWGIAVINLGCVLAQEALDVQVNWQLIGAGTLALLLASVGITIAKYPPRRWRKARPHK
jgi:hypothetical protein